MKYNESRKNFQNVGAMSINPSAMPQTQRLPPLTVETSNLAPHNFGHKRSLADILNSSSPGMSSLKLRSNITNIMSPRLNQSSLFQDHRKKNNPSRFMKTEPIEEKEEKDMVQKLETSFEIEPEDKKKKSIIGKKLFIFLIGDRVLDSYYHHYKKLDRIKEQNTIFSTPDSSYTAMLNKTEYYNVLPSTLGLIKTKGDEKKMKINNYKYGDKYMDVLSEGLKLLPNIQHFNLSSNRITEKGADSLLANIPKNTKTLELCSNNIGLKGTNHLYNLLTSRECRIELLNLEDNKLGDHSIGIVCEGVILNTSLRKLNISKNFLSNAIGEQLKNMITKNTYLTELYLHWNQLKAAAGKEIFTSLIENESLRVFDISWNCIGNGNPSIIEIIEDVLIRNENIVHMDMSSKRISKALEMNKTIYGFHFAGNHGFVDSKGFLVISDNKLKELKDAVVAHRIKEIIKNLKRKPDEFLKDSCWICEGWQEFDFSWVPKKSGAYNRPPIYLHMDFEGYQGKYLGKSNKKKKMFEFKRIVPPSGLNFFYTTGSTQDVNKLYDDFKPLDPYLTMIEIQPKEFHTVKLEKMNYAIIPKNVPFLQNYLTLSACRPREKDNIYKPPRTKLEKRIWTFPISLFKDWRRDDEEILKKCFEFDWSNIIFPSKLVKNETDLAETKETFRAVYKIYKECYKYNSSLFPVGDVWSWSNYVFNDVISETKIVDNKLITPANVTINYTATMSHPEFKTSNYRNPERGMVRFQVIECIIRLAEEKYVKGGVASSFKEGLEIILKDHFAPYFEKFIVYHQKWRDDRYWNEECDDVLKAYKPVIENLYSRYSKKKVKPGQKPFMCLDELGDMCKHSGLYDENFVERDVNLAYNLSMMTQIDELNFDRTFQMSFVEFLEALGRIAEKLSPIPIGYDPGPEWNYEKRNAQFLHYKIEALLVILLRNCCDVTLRETWPIPTKSMFDKVIVQDDSEEEDSPII